MLARLLKQHGHAVQGFCFDPTAVVLVDQQAIGRYQQKRPRLLERWQVLKAQQFDEGVVGQVGGIVGTAKFLA
ncbi:hypothetical protein D3C79_881360 [compost metagenome]